jgi:OPT oligopeptide transporter protein
MSVGINSTSLSYLTTGFISQWYLRKHRPNWFIKYNYVLSAAMDGGTQVLVFITTFGLQGGAGKNVPFPEYWGNNQKGNFDMCMRDPALSASDSSS